MDEKPNIKKCRTCLHDLPIQSFDSDKVDGQYETQSVCRLCVKIARNYQSARERRIRGKLDNFDAWILLDNKNYTPVGNRYYETRASALLAKNEIGGTVIVRRVKINILKN